MIKIFSIITIIFHLFVANAFSCTTFCFKDEQGNIYFGRNFDFPTGIGTININQRGVLKKSFLLEGEQSFTWVSKYGSITFNQNGREFPYGGMNETGLVIEQLMMGETVYPPNDDRAGLEELQWIQYQLDVAATVNEVIHSDAIVRISNKSIAPLHFSVADSQGNFAVIEYINGEMVAYSGKNAEVNVLANEAYSSGLEKLKNDDNKARFVKAAKLLETYPEGNYDALDFSFDVLKKVSQGEWTRWSIVYDITNRRIYYKTGVDTREREINLNVIDFSCSQEKLFFNINDNLESVDDFRKYNYKENYSLIDSVWKQIEFLSALPPEFKKRWAGYPVEVSCAH